MVFTFTPMMLWTISLISTAAAKFEFNATMLQELQKRAVDLHKKKMDAINHVNIAGDSKSHAAVNAGPQGRTFLSYDFILGFSTGHVGK